MKTSALQETVTKNEKTSHKTTVFTKHISLYKIFKEHLHANDKTKTQSDKRRYMDD